MKRSSVEFVWAKVEGFGSGKDVRSGDGTKLTHEAFGGPSKRKKAMGGPTLIGNRHGEVGVPHRNFQ